MAEEGKKISFGFAKSIKKSLLKNVPSQEERKVDYIECLDEKAIKVLGKVEEEAKPLVIPLIGSRTWHDRIINKIDADIFEPKTTENGNDKPTMVKVKKEPENTVSNGNVSEKKQDMVKMVIKTEPVDDTEMPATNSLEEQAVKEIMQALKSENDATQEAKVLTLPLAEDESLRGKDESTLEDYEQIPVDSFGLAMLRGMGWQPGRGIGKNEKVISAVIPELRPKGMGLGADKVTLQKQSTNSKEKQEELKTEKGSFVKIIAGKHNNCYGQIEGLDDDAGRLIVKMALGGNTVSLNEFMVQPVSHTEYAKNAKVLNATKYEEYKNKETGKSKASLTSDSSDDTKSSSNEEEYTRSKNKEIKKDSRKSKVHHSRQEQRDRKRYSSENDSDEKRSRKKRKNSSSSDEPSEYKTSKSSKKNKHRDHSIKRSSKKSKKSHKREHKEDKKYRHSKSSDKTKHKKHKRSRSRSRSPKER